MHPAWIVPFLLAVASVAACVYWGRRRTIRELTALARKRGLTFSSIDLIGLHDRYNNLELIRRGHNRHVWNVLYGSIDLGLVAAFRYSYEIGFGVQQSVRHWWITVLERPHVFPAWRAAPGQAGETAGSGPGSGAVRIGGRLVQADHADALGRFQDPGLAAMLGELPVGWEIEARGKLLAIAVPVDDDEITPESLLDAVGQLGERLNRAGL